MDKLSSLIIIMSKKVKAYIDYPIAKTLAEAVEWLRNGGELWKELINLEEGDKEGTCFQIDNLEDLLQSDFETVGLDEDISEDKVHLVVAGE